MDRNAERALSAAGAGARLVLMSHNLHLARDFPSIRSAAPAAMPGGNRVPAVGTFVENLMRGRIFSIWMLCGRGRDSQPCAFPSRKVETVKGTLNEILCEVAPVLTRSGWSCGTRREVQGRTPTMNEYRKTDSPVVPMKSPNKAGQPAAEETEGRGLARGNPPQQNAPQTQSRQGAPSALERVRQAAGRDRKMRLAALLHQVYNRDTLRADYLNLKREAAAGVDGETWRHYGERPEENLQDLADRLKRGAYRAKPVRRV